MHLPTALGFLANYALRNPDLNINEILHGQQISLKTKPRFILKGGIHPEMLPGEKFLSNILPEEFEKIQSAFPSVRMGEKPSLLHGMNGKTVSKLRPVFISVEESTRMQS